MSKLKDYIKGKYKKYELFAPSEFWDLTDEEKAEVTNGCGAASAAIDFVPDTIYGLDISASCDIHDFSYNEGGLEEDKFIADLFLLINALQIIKQESSNNFTKTLRYSRAIKYFYAVDFFGDDAFRFLDPECEAELEEEEDCC